MFFAINFFKSFFNAAAFCFPHSQGKQISEILFWWWHSRWYNSIITSSVSPAATISFDPFDSSNAVDTDLVAASPLQICTIWSSLVRYSESSEISWLLLLFGKKCSFECGVSFYSCTVTFCDETLDFGLLHVYSILLISPHHKHQKQYIYHHNFSNITYIYFWILHLSASEHDTLMPHRQVY